MIRLLIIFGSIALTAQASKEWNSYQSIVDRAPFGQAPPAPEMPIIQPNGAFAKQYRLCMLYEDSNGELRAGLVSKTDDKSIVLNVGETEGGISLVDVQIDDGFVVLQKGTETARLVLEGLHSSSRVSASPAAVASVPSIAGARRVVRAGTSGVTDQIRTALTDSRPKRAQLTRVTRIASSGGGAGRRSTSRRSSGTSSPSGTGGIPAGSVASVKLTSNGYSIQHVPRHIKIDM